MLYRDVQWIAAEVGSGSPFSETGTGPLHFFNQLRLHRTQFFRVSEESTGCGAQALEGIATFSRQLAVATGQAAISNKVPIVVGGDHSCAIGTWSGLSSIYGSGLGLLWVDAHMDSHTFETTESNAIHGMPVAALLGEGAEELTQIISAKPKINPENLVLFGVRSFEEGEYKLLRGRGVRVYTIEEIQERGFRETWSEAVAHLESRCSFWGMSLDLDSMDPDLIPGVGSPVANGLNPKDVLGGMKSILESRKFVGLEIAEFNPEFDQYNQTLYFLLNVAEHISKITDNGGAHISADNIRDPFDTVRDVARG